MVETTKLCTQPRECRTGNWYECDRCGDIFCHWEGEPRYCEVCALLSPCSYCGALEGEACDPRVTNLRGVCVDREPPPYPTAKQPPLPGFNPSTIEPGPFGEIQQEIEAMSFVAEISDKARRVMTARLLSIRRAIVRLNRGIEGADASLKAARRDMKTAFDRLIRDGEIADRDETEVGRG